MENDIEVPSNDVDIQRQQPVGARPSHEPANLKSFNEQITVSEDTYKIPIKKQVRGSSTITNIILKSSMDHNAVMVEKKSDTKKSYGNGIINSVENFQIIPKPIVINSDENKKNEAMVLQQPIMPKTSTSINDLANKKTSESVNNLHVPILAAPTAERPANEPKNNSSSTSTTTSTTTKKSVVKPKSKLPVGVVPIPDMINDDANKNEENNFSHIPDSSKANKKAQSLNEKDKNELNFLDGNGNGEQENGANEVQVNWTEIYCICLLWHSVHETVLES